MRITYANPPSRINIIIASSLISLVCKQFCPQNYYKFLIYANKKRHQSLFSLSLPPFSLCLFYIVLVLACVFFYTSTSSGLLKKDTTSTSHPPRVGYSLCLFFYLHLRASIQKKDTTWRVCPYLLFHFNQSGNRCVCRPAAVCTQSPRGSHR